MDQLQIDFGDGASEERYRRLIELHAEAARRTSSAEKAIDGMAAAGLLDARAGVNYLLMGHSLLVDSTRPARRLLLPDQERLRADADVALAREPRAPHGHEDLALWRLRAHDVAGAREAFRRALDRDPDAWPSLVGLGVSIQAGSRSLERVLEEAIAAPELPDLERLVDPWGALTEAERQVVALALAPIARLVPALVAAGGRLHVVALDARLTDLPAFAEVQGQQVEDGDDRRVYDAISGMCTGVTAAVTVGTLYQVESDGWTVAHELGHALHAILADAPARRIEALYEHACAEEWLSTEYGLTNPWEFFATGYERFALRHAFPDAPRTELDGADVALGVDALLHDLTRAAPDAVLAPEVTRSTSPDSVAPDSDP